ncbi:hypothetical protein PR003_g23664 [Phytophthora rubi]|uniref:Uncharacterized protein n=1 Tax=Phytophthora rubi TaxID=129364 RepID=A0A6A4D2X9_9STRA|nr:hypothetical protein PR002_g22691 [Phytophthora rubi]KAE9296809.1 hypothetical protein PR003_g23664 [Phytophthora rubi]
MAVVAPTCTEAKPQDESPSQVCAQIGSASRWLCFLWTRLPGQYTASKLDAFEQFRLQSSHWKVLAILLLTPGPCLLANLLLESIPLADPATGFRHSVAFQLRHFFASVIQTMFPALVKKNCVPDFAIGSWKLVAAFAVIQGAIAISTNAVISLSTGVYPVPFAHFTPSIPMGVIGTLLCYRRQAWGPESSDFRAKSTKVDHRLAMEMLPIFVYPVFTALFMSLPPREQLWLSLLLPVIKLALKRWLWLVSRSDGDLVGGITCCVGHLYHILFTDVILQNAKSVQTLAVVVLFNVGQMLLNCRYIMKDASALEIAKQQLQGEYLKNLTDNVAYNAMRFANESDVADKLHAQQPTALLSTYPGYHRKAFVHRHSKRVRGSALLSSPSLAHVKRLSVTSLRRMHQDAGRRGSNSTTMSSSWSKQGSALVQVLPVSGNQRRSISLDDFSSHAHLLQQLMGALELSKVSSIESHSTITREVYVQRVVSALHQTEMILLRSYITIVATSFYVFYLVYIFELPNRPYFATLVSMSTIADVGQTSQRLLLLCGLEIVFLGIYVALIQRRLGVSALYQLAFVLRSQFILVQAKFVMLSLVILGFPLAHYGNGISIA